ncbi:MAG: DUF4143 domain-containing protein [Micrococcales bacterium]|nr:DUF4143 domain-containing protein [Micrococcales bacterium]
MEQTLSPPVVLPRAVEPFLRPDDTIKIKVLQGPRAAGKTTVAMGLVAAGFYDRMVSLADPDTLARAQADIRLFVDDLGPRAVVDEAQLLGEPLSLALKEVVDRPGTDRRFLLTGSARIARTGLGGADPLTGRVEPWTLDPLSATEVRGDADALARMVDRLFGPVPGENTPRVWPTRPASAWMSTGGLPTWSIGALSDARRQQVARAYRDGVLTEHVLAEERFDLAAANRVLDCLLRSPAGSLNVTSVAQRLEMDTRTVNKYLDVLERRFLVRLLPNLALNPARQARRNAKVHAVDLSIARQALASADPAVLTQTTTTGLLFETWVVNQALAGCPFAERKVDAFSWRTSRGDREVDLVLARQDGSRVGVEVKLSTSVHPTDARGLNALAESGGLHAGYVVYPGSELVRLGERVWALPVPAYLQGWAHSRPTDPGKTTDMLTPVSLKSAPDVAATIFVSYVRADDKHLRGAITSFATDLAEEYHFSYGRTLDVFVDTLSVRWGESWMTRLAAEIDKTSFLLANVTPRFLTSEACREEITRFATAASAAGDARLVLALMWSPIDDLNIVDPADPVLRLVRESQWEDAADLATLERGSAAYRQRLQRVVHRLHQTVTSREQGTQPGPVSAGPPQDSPDVFEVVADLGPASDAFFRSFTSFMDALGEGFGDLGPDAMDPGHVALLRRRLDPLTADLTSATHTFARCWDATLRLFADPALRPVLAGVLTREQLLESAAQWELADKEQALTTLAAIGRVSRLLRPAVSAATGAIRAVDAIRTGALAWADELEQ